MLGGTVLIRVDLKKDIGGESRKVEMAENRDRVAGERGQLVCPRTSEVIFI